MSNKIVVAKPTFDARTETDPNNLIFSSDYNTLKYAVSGNYQMVGVTADTNVTIAHNLGYVPFFICYVNDFLSNPTLYGLTQFFKTDGGQFRALRAYVDATNIYLSANLVLSSPATINWYYKIFKNNLNL